MFKIHVIGQAPPKPPYPEFPFGRSKMYKWFEDMGLSNWDTYDVRDEWNKILKTNYNGTEVTVAFDAIFNKFPGSNKNGHLKPTREEILSCKEYLQSSLEDVNADLIIAVGGLAISYCLNEDSYDETLKKVVEVKLNEVIGKEFNVKPFGLIESKVVIPLPHPSGASTWFYKDGNMELLNKALKLIEKIKKNSTFR